VTVSWEEPMDTGYGDGSAVVEYIVETSICPDFSETPACVYHSQFLDGLSLNFTRFVFTVAGEIYYIRVTAQNQIGGGVYSETRQGFMIMPLILSPVVSWLNPLRVASGGSFVHVWADGSDRSFDGVLRVRLFGLEIYDVSSDMQAELVFNGAVSSHQVSVLGTEIPKDAGMFVVSLILPAFSPQEFPCPTGVCAGAIVMSSRLTPKKKVSLYIEYFGYPEPEVVNVLPIGGSEYGGAQVNVRIRDFLGDETRHGAGLPSFSDSLSKGTEIFVRSACGNKTSLPALAVSKFLPGVLASTVEGFGVYELAFRMPKSPCGAENALLRFEMFQGACRYENCSWQPYVKGIATFEYRGPGILDVSPASGMINRGNQRIIITIVLENIGTINDMLRVTLGDVNCTLEGPPVQLQTDDSDLVVLQILSPELPRDAPSRQQLVVTISSSLRFQHVWEYLQPPEPQVVTSFRVDGEMRDVLWLKKTSITASVQDPTIDFDISRLSPKYGIDFSSLQVWFHESRSRVANEMFASVGVNVKLSFTLDIRGLPEGLYNMTVHIILHSKIIQVLNVPGHVEIRDMSIPTLIRGAIAPSEGPAFGGTFVLLGVSGASPLLSKSLSFKVIRQDGEDHEEVNGDLLGRAIPLNSWGTDDSEYLATMKSSAGLKQGSKQLVLAYENVVNMVNDVTPADETGAFLVVQMPAMLNISGPVTGVVSTADNTARINFAFTYVPTPVNAATVIAARTLLGTASGNMDGGYQISIAVSNFIITYNILELVIEFGSNRGIIIKMDQSDSIQTKLTALVPAGDPGTIKVSIYNRNHRANEATFAFEYIDTRIPVVEYVSPTQVYSDGGYQIHADIAKFPGDTKVEEAIIQMQDASGQALGFSFQPDAVEQVGISQDGHVLLRFSFLTQGLQGNMDASIRVILLVRGKTAEFELSYLSTPTGAPVIYNVNPSEAACTDLSQKVTLRLNNIRMVTDPSALHLTFGNVSLGSDQKVAVISTMSETRVSFFMPGLMEHIVGPVRLTVQSGEESAAFTTIKCKDARKAQLLYTLPASGYAGEEIFVTLGIRRFGPVTLDYLNVFSRSAFALNDENVMARETHILFVQQVLVREHVCRGPVPIGRCY